MILVINRIHPAGVLSVKTKLLNYEKIIVNFCRIRAGCSMCT